MASFWLWFKGVLSSASLTSSKLYSSVGISLIERSVVGVFGVLIIVPSE